MKKGGKTVKKAKKQRRATRFRSSRHGRVAAPAPRNYEAMQLSKLVAGFQGKHSRHLQLQELLYCYAPELAELAFKSGFGIGVDAYRTSGGGMGALERLMFNSGFGHMVYYTFEASSVLGFSGVDAMGENIGANMHVFESGIVSGYMSAHSRRSMYAKEESCVFNGAKRCTFVVRQHGAADEGHAVIGYAKALAAMESALGKRMGCTPGAAYLLAMSPLFGEPLLSEASKFLYMTGKQLSRGGGGLEERLKAIAGFLGIKSVSVSAPGMVTRSVTLSYSHESSVRGFVDLTTALVSGFVKGRLGKNPSVERNVSRTGTYIIRLLFK